MFMPQRLRSPTPSAGEDWRLHLGNNRSEMQPTEPCSVDSKITSFRRTCVKSVYHLTARPVKVITTLNS